jgi:DNA-binding CsgD family transcriptional regulator
MIASMDRRRTAFVDALRYLDRSAIVRYGAAVVIVAAGLVLREVLLPGIGDRSPFLVFVLAVLVASVLCGTGPGVLATALSAIVAVVLFLPPVGRISLTEPSDLVRLSIFGVVGLVAAAVGGGFRGAVLRSERLAVTSGRVRRLLRLEGSAIRLAADEPPVEALTDRELEVMHLVALGLRNDEIAETLVVSGNTVKSHLAHAYGKLGVRSRTEAVARCATLGLLDRPEDHREAPGP